MTAGAFVIESEPGPGPAAGECRTVALRAAPNGLICTRRSGGARSREAQIFDMRGPERWAVDFPVTLRHVRI